MIINKYDNIFCQIMQQCELMEKIFDPKTISILKILLRDNRQRYLQEISIKANVPIATTLRILNKLEKAGVVRIEKISRMKLYSAKANEESRFLAKIFKEETKVLEIFAERIQEIDGLKQVILHGKQQKDRANVLLIGESMESEKIKEICEKIKKEYNFTINSLTLSKTQYAQMSQMGLYSENKKILVDL